MIVSRLWRAAGLVLAKNSSQTLIICFESLAFWSSSSVLTDKGRAELEARQP